jgi:Tol biopolymer transport system component
MMVPDKNEETIFEAAVELQDPAARARFVAQACGDDLKLRSEVETLLRSHDSRSLLDAPVLDSAAPGDQNSLTEGPGTIIGRYKLLEKIGEGGMAVVYMAEQTEPIRRKVALKIIKLGMDTRQVIARFEAERQALALMDHPSIAKVLDAGATDTGRPYFVMELVQGVSITEYCDKNSLSTKDRLALFLQVCHAVQHAHQKGIIHRDIKPSNVMVTHHDGRPVPKVIDFGIAKATNQKLTEKTLFTRYAHIIGTPAYMSPEQAELTDLDIDTRSDIYSLGVLLYELLTGTTPFSEEELRKAGYLEMQRVIREQEPVKPSTKLSTLGETLTDIAKCRSSTPDLLRRAIRGDLDWIVMKSLEKDRARRYETASGLAEDILRHLESEPVLARGPTTAYRLGKFLRRHRVQVLVGVMVVILVAIAGVLLSIWNQDRLQWNRDRLQLVEAERLQHENLLDRARDQYAKAQRETALKMIQPILDSPHVGDEAQLLRAGILVDNRRFKEARTVLNDLLNDRSEIAGAAHALVARILWETGSLDAQKLEEIEEHRQKAEELRPETAEAYFLRAMTALTVKEQLGALDKALQLDASHYESRRLRAFTYYASRKYERMKDDALAMTVLRPRDPLGYSLHAAAWRELGHYPESIADYDNALALTAKDSPEYLDLSSQRCETLLRMGDYERVIAEGQECLKRWPDKPVFQRDIFCALTALGDYDKATLLYHRIVSPGYNARTDFQAWCAKYVFDTLAAGRSWHPADREPAGAAFLSLVEAQETYRDLAARGRRLITDGFGATWSPNGKKLAFSLGVQGRSGVALFDPATKETDLLIAPGKDPKWSPDGKYIAFVRDRQSLRMGEPATEDEKRLPLVAEEEVWLMKSDGTDPRCLVQGGWPSWSQDSRAVYYHSRTDQTLCSIPVEGQDARPRPIMKCSALRPSVSPDNRQVVYFEQGSLKIQNLASQALVADCPVSSLSWGVTAWSPSGNEVLLAGGNPARQKTGLWLYDLPTKVFSRVLDGQLTGTCWSSGATELALCVGLPYSEVWVAPLDPKVPPSEALGPGRTVRDYYRQIAALYTRRIQADPLDADAYLRRGEQYHFLHQERRVRADLRQYAAIVTQGQPLEVPSVPPWDTERVIEGPFGYQIVFSLDESEDRLPILSVACGQKGRSNMKSFEIPMIVTSLVGLCFLSGLEAPPARADFTFGAPVKFGSGSSSDDQLNCLSSDGLEMYITATRGGGQGGFDLWVRKRASKEEPWGPPQNLGPGANSSDTDWDASISADGLTLYFDRLRSIGGTYAWDLFTTTRATKNDPWGPAIMMGPQINGSGHNSETPWISGDGLELYFESTRSGGYGSWDLYVSKRATTSDPWGNAVNLGPLVNGPSGEFASCLSPDGLLLFFMSGRPGGYGGIDLWMTRRASRSDPWEPAVNLGPKINSPLDETIPRISPDGRTLYLVCGHFGSDTEQWQAPILPNCDFNGDGKVAAADLDLLLANWGKSNSRCDIGPYPWGNGVVDERDLSVLMETLTGTGLVRTPLANASEIRCDASLAWAAVPSASSYDVYFGPSLADVDSADRAHPQGVLVSQGQTATQWKPSGPLSYGQTCYWRVDFVGSGPAPTIYKGSVLDFTTERYGRPITNVTAAASSAQPSMGPEKTVDGSGLDQHDGHSTDQKTMWWSLSTPPQWIQYEFDKVYPLHELWVWNFNMAFEPGMGFGARTVKIEYSTDGTAWTPLANVPEFARAPGQDGYVHNTTVSFGGVSAKFVRLTINSTWGTTPQTGLSEVRFFYVPLQAATPQPANNATGVKVDAGLNWLAGREAGSHTVFFGTDPNAVANGTATAKTVATNTFDPGALNCGTKYYWRVDEVNTVTYPGEVWSFTTQEFAVVDDFESYTDEEGQRIYQTWIDGFTNNLSGSTVGYAQSPFAEQTVRHAGRQSMPLAYDNSKTPFYSETTRDLGTAQDWTGNGADTLTLWFRGNPIDFLQRADGSIQMSGGGADIWGTSDQFRFAYKQLSGDGTVVAKVRSLTATSTWAKAGVMIRGSLDPAATNAFMFPTPEGQRDFQNRPTTGGNTVGTYSDPGTITLPFWVKVERKGTNFTGYYSQDGVNWIKQPGTESTGVDRSANPVRLAMTGPVYIGLAVTSHNASMTTIAEFSDVSFTGTVTGEWQVAAVGVAQPSNAAAPLYVAVEDSAGHVKAVTHPDPAAVQSPDWQEWMIPLSNFQGVNLAGVKKMYIGVGDRSKPTAGGTGVIYLDDIGFGHPLSAEQAEKP